MRWELVLVGICVATWAGAAERATSLPAASLPSVAPSASPLQWDQVLDGLRLEFYSPDSDERFTAHPPFDVIHEEPDRVDLRASTEPGKARPHLTLVQTPAGLWAIARFAEHEFATRIE